MMFVGEERLEIVNGLVDALAAVSDGGGPRAVVLSAPTGWGKTAIVQEFYARIAAQQPTPAYWPVRLEGEASLGWTQTRKRVAPLAFDVPASAELPWMWWGISCARRQDGRYAQAMFDDASQLALHGGSLFARMSQGGLGGRTFDGTSALVSVLGLLGVALVPPAAVGLAVAGAGRTLWQSRDLLDRLSQWKSRRETKQMGFSIDVESHSKVDQLQQLANDLEAISRKVPIVLIVDDAQWADSTLLETLSWVMRRSTARVLVVATTWPLDDEREETNPFHMWTQEMRRSVSLSGAVDLIELGTFSDAALRQLVLDEFLAGSPSAEADLHADVVDGVLDLVGGTPMGVRALFGLARTKALIADGDFTLEAIGSLPADLDEALRSYWKEIPPDVQTVLAIAAVTGHKFLPAPVIAAAAAQGIEDAAEKLRRGENPHTYVRSIEPELAAFIDPVFFGTAVRAADEIFTPKQVQVIREALAKFALRATLEVYPTPICELAWSAHVTLAEKELVEVPPASNSAFQLAELASSRFDLALAIGILRRTLPWAENFSNMASTNHRNLLAVSLLDSGCADEALVEFELLAADTARVFGPDHEATVSVRNNLASSLKDLGRLDDALVEFESLVADRARVLGPDHEDTLRVRNNLASSLMDLGRLDDALVEFESLVADSARVLGPDHEDTLNVRHNLADALGHTGKLADAIDLLEDLIRERERLGFERSVSAFSSLNAKAYFVAEAGRTDEALELFERLLVEQIEILGLDHPDTIRTRVNRACLEHDNQKAESDFRALVGDAERVFGPSHPKTLRTREAHALTLLGVDAEECRRLLQGLLEDRIRSLGSRHPDTLHSQLSLAKTMIVSERFSEANEILVPLLVDQQRILGDSHPDTFDTLNDLARTEAALGHVDEALQDFAKLLKAQEQSYGSDHPDALRTRNNIGYWLGEVGKFDEAVRVLEEVLSDARRVFGPEGSGTQAIRSNLERLALLAAGAESRSTF